MKKYVITKSRIKIFIGLSLIAFGLVCLLVVNAVFNYSNTALWIVGAGLMVMGFVIAQSSPEFIAFFTDLEIYHGQTNKRKKE